MKFTDFGLAEPVLRAVLQEGYSTATPIQVQAIPSVLEGHDVIGIAQTGTGKTAAFALPILHRLLNSPSRPGAGASPVKVLVLASTRELAQQIHESFRSYGAFAPFKAVCIFGGVGQQPQVNALRRGAQIVIATPGRLLDLLNQRHVNLETLQTLVLDEADRMLDMGFFPSIRRILQWVPKKRQTLLFSATMKPEIRELASSILHDPVSISVVPKQKTTELVEQSVCFVPQKQKTRLLIHLITQHQPKRAIVFSRTKHGADRIVRNLTAAGLRAEAIHANKSQNRRQRILEEFKGHQPPILVATDIAARGIDVDAVSHVFIHDMPTEEETYVHRIGRSGRAGATGVSIALCDSEERKMLRSIEKLIGMQIDVLEVPGFDVHVEMHEPPRASANRPRNQSNPRRRSKAASDTSVRSGRRDRPQFSARQIPEPHGDRAQGRKGAASEAGKIPVHKDLGRQAERKRRSDPRSERPVPSNMKLRRQTDRRASGRAHVENNSHRAVLPDVAEHGFGAGLDVD